MEGEIIVLRNGPAVLQLFGNEPYVWQGVFLSASIFAAVKRVLVIKGNWIFK